jgi:hypothetical protein
MAKAVAKVEELQVPAPQPAANGESAALIHIIERAARDPAVDIVKMERLFEMAERVKAREAEAAFNTDMSAAQIELVPIARNQRNKQTNSNYTDLAAIAEGAMPIIHRHGFGVITSEFESKKPDHLGVVCEVTHRGGHSKRYEFNIPWDGAGLKGNANKTATHAYGSTLSYGERYAKCKIFGIATKDDDGNAASKVVAKATAAPITAEQVQELTALFAKMPAPAESAQITLQHWGAETLADLTSVQYTKTAAQLKEKLGL